MVKKISYSLHRIYIILFFIILFLITLVVLFCSLQRKKLLGKYINIYDKTNYLIFNKDGSFINNSWTTTSKGVTRISDFYSYKIDDNNLITIIDTSEYVGVDTHYEYELGILYKNYIGVKWNGTLPKRYENATIISIYDTPEDVIITFNFKEDKSYERISTYNNEIVKIENGIYTINDDNEVVCTREDGLIITFFNVGDKVFSIEYIKE